MRVTHVITGLGAGGAEAMLYKLVCATSGRGLTHAVVSLTGGGTVGEQLIAAGVSVTCLGMRPGVPTPLALARLVGLLRRDRPELIQAWMYHANLMAGLAAAATRLPVVWGIHHADVDPRHVKALTRLTRSLCARLSGALPARIVCCADSALRSHVALGYRADRMVAIPNGFEIDRFDADTRTRAEVRRQLSIGEAAPVVGLVARVHPDKDHRTFLSAARLLAEQDPEVVFVLAGEGATASNAAMRAWIDPLRLGARVRLLGRRADVARLLTAMDVLASSSRSEGFPQILGEAMLCGVPCAATDCGDSREIVGPTGRVVPPGDPSALAGAIRELLTLPRGERAALGARARERIVARYDIREIARRYTELYLEVASAPSAGAPGARAGGETPSAAATRSQ